MQLTGPGAWGPAPDVSTAVALIRLAFSLGVRVFDTAWYYGPDVANSLIETALSPYSEDLILVTKLGNSRGADGSWVPNINPNYLRSSCERDLRTLKTDCIPLTLLRWNLNIGSRSMFESSLNVLSDLKSEGKIREIGLSNVNARELGWAEAIIDIAAVSNSLSLNNRVDLPTVEWCDRVGALYLPFYPLLGGDLAQNKFLEKVGLPLGLTPAQLSIAWLRSVGNAVVPIPGTGREIHLKENTEAQGITISAAIRRELEMGVSGRQLS